jgi:serine/threonine protein kinase
MSIVSKQCLSIAKYQGERVVVNKLPQSSIDLKHRQILVDIKNMRELNQENINSFVGLCTESPNVSIIMAYASRGSIRSILDKEDNRIDWHIKTSFLDDIASGMSYLHLSPVRFHGNLTSHKCVVDGRWTCKITGHGLKSLAISYSHTNATDQLWVAPEILRAMGPLKDEIYIKGDTFSFAIIAQELIMQDQPYGEFDLDLISIINRLKQGSDPPFRQSFLVNGHHDE